MIHSKIESTNAASRRCVGNASIIFANCATRGICFYLVEVKRTRCFSDARVSNLDYALTEVVVSFFFSGPNIGTKSGRRPDTTPSINNITQLTMHKKINIFTGFERVLFASAAGYNRFALKNAESRLSISNMIV